MATSSGKSLTTASSSHISYPSQMESEAAGSRGQEDLVVENRLWIGNLDPKLTEYNLLKLVQKYGSIAHFDFLFHRSGPNIGLPRGYAFVEFKDKKAAEICMSSLDGKKVLDRFLAIRWAHQAIHDYPDEQTKLKAKLPALAMKKDSESLGTIQNKDKAISAIEAKLKAMEKDKDALNFLPSNNKPQQSSSTTSNNINRYHRPVQKTYNNQPNVGHNSSDRNRKPYSR